jgi:hypothetical protein
MVLDPKQADALLAEELHRMSFEDRESMQEEIHGIKSLAPSETPEMRNESLRLFRQEVHRRLHQRIEDRQRHHQHNWHNGNRHDAIKDQLLDLLVATDERSTNEACRRYDYIYSNDFMIRFIRAELFDTAKAIDRWMVYLELLLEYYGMVALERPLLLEDLTEPDLTILRAGILHILPSRDRFNRRVFCILAGFDKSHSLFHRVSAHLVVCLK